MNNSKYYSGQGEVEYNNNLGTIYYTPTGGTGNDSSKFMTTANFSRTERTKTMSVVPINNNYNVYDTFNITQNDSPLMILLDDIDGKVPHGSTNPTEVSSNNNSYYFTYKYPIHQDDLGKTIDVVVLTNGNVISVQSDSIGNNAVITALPKIYYPKLPENGYVKYYPLNGDESYEDYPTGIGTNTVSSYLLDYKGSFKYYYSFDEINNSSGIATNINVTGSGAGGLITNDYITYGEIEGLIIIKFSVEINDNVPSDTVSTLNIGTAVYNEHGTNYVDSTWPLYRELKLTFEYDVLNPSIEVGEDLNFNADGTEEGTTNHEPTVDIESNITWQITE